MWNIEVAPDGSVAYVSTDAGVVPIDTATNRPDPAITVGGGLPFAIAVTPNGKTAYVTGLSADQPNTVTPIDLARRRAGTPIDVIGSPQAITVSPDGRTAYVVLEAHALVPVDTSTNRAGPRVHTGLAFAFSIAITPDQAPHAGFAVQAGRHGTFSRFDASGSSAAVGRIARYAWRFGDGTTAATTTPLIGHAYAAAGTYTAVLTVTDSAGTSTQRVYTGQTMLRNGGPGATAEHTVTVG